MKHFAYISNMCYNVLSLLYFLLILNLYLIFKKDTMKKIIMFMLMFIVTISCANAYVNWMTIQLKSSEISTNDTTYMSVFLLDEKAWQILNATPIIKSTPSYPVEIGEFVSCASAEGRTLCSKVDNELVWLGWAYVAKITSKDIDEDVMLTIYSDSTENAKVKTRELKIWKGKSTKSVTLEEVPKVGADNIKWMYLVYLIMILVFIFGISSIYVIKFQKQEK